MVRIQYQLLKDNEPIALGSMVHCLDVFYWEIYHGYNHLAYNIVPFRQDEEVYRKAKAFDEIVRIYNHYELNLTVDEDDTFEVIARFIQEWGNKEYLLKEDKQND